MPDILELVNRRAFISFIVAASGIRLKDVGSAGSENEASSEGTVLSDDEANLTLEQRWRPRGWLDLAWGYSVSGRAVSFELPDLPARPIDFDGLLASINATAVLDRRNSVFDPTRGWFYSTSLQWGLQAVGSDFDYLRTLIRAASRPLSRTCSYSAAIGPAR